MARAQYNGRPVMGGTNYYGVFKRGKGNPQYDGIHAPNLDTRVEATVIGCIYAQDKEKAENVAAELLDCFVEDILVLPFSMLNHTELVTAYNNILYHPEPVRPSLEEVLDMIEPIKLGATE